MKIALVVGFFYYALQGIQSIDGIPFSTEGDLTHDAISNRSFKSRVFGINQ